MFDDGCHFLFDVDRYTTLLRTYRAAAVGDVPRLTQLRQECQRHWLGLSIKQRSQVIKKVGHKRVGVAPHDVVVKSTTVGGTK
jgi:hypothetical protein